MRHVLALAIKTFMVAAILYIVLTAMYNYPLGPTMVVALLITGLSYLVGDLGVLPMTNNMIATLSDVGLATLTIWLIAPFMMGAYISFWLALMSGAIIGVGEWFFHPYFEEVAMPRKDAL